VSLELAAAVLRTLLLPPMKYVSLSLSLTLVNWYHEALIKYMAIARAPG